MSTKRQRLTVRLYKLMLLARFNGDINSTRQCLLFISKHFERVMALKSLLWNVTKLIFGASVFVVVMLAGTATPRWQCDLKTHAFCLLYLFVGSCILYGIDKLKTHKGKKQ